jgi:hypothetical protein
LGRAGAPFFAAAQRSSEREGGKGAPFFAAPCALRIGGGVSVRPSRRFAEAE